MCVWGGVCSPPRAGPTDIEVDAQDVHGITYGAAAVRVSKAAWVPPELLATGEKVPRGGAQGCKVAGTLTVKKVKRARAHSQGRANRHDSLCVLCVCARACVRRSREISTLRPGAPCARRASTCTR